MTLKLETVKFVCYDINKSWKKCNCFFNLLNFEGELI